MSKVPFIPVPLLVVALLATGCSESTTTATGPVSVIGTVTEIVDQVPVDGGVTITLKTDDGGLTTLIFGSLFTYPPPGEEQIALYEKIRTLEVGYRIVARGTRVEAGVLLEDLSVVKRS